jgi:methylamine--corrinoid protein Co-methyltransferase
MLGCLRPSDSHEISQLNELKIDNAGLNMIAGWTANGDTIMVEQMPIFGGYTGGMEETAICDIATTLTSFTLLNGSYPLDGPIHIRWGITTARETLKVAGHAAAALNAHTDFLLANQYYPIAGPCTEMGLLETAAQAIVDTASGRELLSGSAVAKGVAQDYTTGMEARMMGEAAMTTAGMKLDDVNRIVDALVKSYEGDYAKAPKGKSFRECYDVLKVTPTDEYIRVYDGAVAKLIDFGLPMKA